MIGLLNRIDIGPSLSETTLTPERGGNSNSLSEIPAVRMIAFENVAAEYWLVKMVPSGRPSKSRTTGPATRIAGVKRASNPMSNDVNVVIYVSFNVARKRDQLLKPGDQVASEDSELVATRASD